MTVEVLSLRPYQQRSVDALYDAYRAGRRRVPLVLPTGAGKTVVFSHVAADAVAVGQRVVALAHRTELIEQAAGKFREHAQGLDVGIVQGQRREFGRAVTVTSMQTACRPATLDVLAAYRPGLVICDETHHIAARSYQTILRELGVFKDDGPLLLGVTATLGRGDGLALSDTFDGPPAEVVPIQELIESGWLLPPRGIRVKVEGMDLSRVRTSNTSESGLNDRAVAQVMHDSLAPAAVARAVREHCAGRYGVAFLPSVELSKEQARVFAEHGLRSVHCDADTPAAVRREIIRRARLGEYDVVCNVGLFTEGTDVPIWSFAVLGRPTSSEVLFQQMAGRPMRPYPGQRDCLLLDVVGVTGRLRIRSVVDMFGADPIEPLEDDLAQYDEDRPVTDVTDDDEPSGGTGVEHHGADGKLHVELIDLFSASHTAWLRSPRGVWFLPTGDGRAVYLAPGPDVDEYDVFWTDGEVIATACTLTSAMSWGEQAARKVAARPLDRTAGWRERRLTRAERLQAIYRGEAPGGEQAPRTGGALVDVQDARWAATAIDLQQHVASVTPAGYWS